MEKILSLLAALFCCMFGTGGGGGGGGGGVAETVKAEPVIFWNKGNVSSLEKFLKEPELGTSWYNPAGPTPTFGVEQKNGTLYRSRLGRDAVMSCKVTALERDLVSW